MNERDIEAERIRTEHEADVRPVLQWAYLVVVLAVGAVLAILLIAYLGGT